MTRRTALATGAASMVLSGAALPTGSGVPTGAIETTSGKVRSTRVGGLSKFFGIRYGRNTAQTRFRKPMPAETWRGVRECNTLGPKTPQGPITLRGATGKIDPKARGLPIIMAVAGITNAQIPESEDCLVLNVITPDASPAKKRPVMVWLHGGGFAMGSGFDAMADGSHLAERGDIVYVSLNHRLNAMGFLYLGALHEDFADSGNAGMLDIVLALEWVRDNIAAFGGAPVGLFFCMDPGHALGAWFDCGMFMQYVMVTARSFGLETCPQQAWCDIGPMVHREMSIPDSQIVLSGMALGYEDKSGEVNTLESTRVSIEEFTQWHR